MKDDYIKYFANHFFGVVAREFEDEAEDIQSLIQDDYVEISFEEFERLQQEKKYYEV